MELSYTEVANRIVLIGWKPVKKMLTIAELHANSITVASYELMPSHQTMA